MNLSYLDVFLFLFFFHTPHPTNLPLGVLCVDVSQGFKDPTRTVI